jgi:hypothetical protein
MSAPAFAVIRCDERTIPGCHPYAHEIALYSPVLVLFPEYQAEGPPWKQRPADYHPRPVEIFLDHARARSPRSWSPKKRILTYISYPVNAVADWLTRLFRKARPMNLKEMLAANLEGGLGRVVLDSGVRPREAAWKRYFSILDDNPAKYPHRCYVHVVAANADKIAIQYWFFFYYNDYWNRHQADFEVVTVQLRRRADELEPTSVYYGAHHDGSYRVWTIGGVWRVQNGTHPIAYVARGSHAFYPAPGIGAPRIPSFPINKRPLGIIDMRAAVAPIDKGAAVADDVAIVSLAQVNAAYANPQVSIYDVRIFPLTLEEINPDNPQTWDEFWWLRFRGHWCPGNWLPWPLPTLDAVQSPSCQDRWPDPWSFLGRCQADFDWREL